MKYLYFDTSFGFSPLMALGALVDMLREEGFVNEILRPFRASVFTENVSRGYFEGCLAHIDIASGDADLLAAVDEAITDSKIKQTAKEYVRLATETCGSAPELREVLEAVCVFELVRSLNTDEVYYCSDSVIEEASAADSESGIPGGEENSILPSGYALLKLLGGKYGSVPGGEMTLVGYGAGSALKNPGGILRAVLFDDNRDGIFMAGEAFEALFAEEIAVI